MGRLPDLDAGKEWWRYISGLIAVGVAVTIILLLVIFAWGAFFGGPPFEVRAISEPPMRPLCPGEEFVVLVEVKTDHTVFILVNISTRGEDGGYYYHPDQPPTFVMPHEGASTFVQPLVWIVPDLPEGIHERVLGFRGHDTDEQPLVLEQPFLIGFNCPKLSLTTPRAPPSQRLSCWKTGVAKRRLVSMPGDEPSGLVCAYCVSSNFQLS